MEELRVVGPVGILGYGVNADSLKRAMAMEPHFIGVDSGSTDCGPYYLGAGDMYQSRKMYKRDMRLLLLAARRAGIPLVVGSAGLAGSRPHVAWAREILNEIAFEEELHFRLAVIHSDQDKDYLARAQGEGRVRSFPGAPALTPETIRACGPLVAQMGIQPYLKALDGGAEVILAGRSCDSAIFASYCIWKGFDRGLSLHLGKLLECAAMSAMPPTGRDVIVGVMRRDHFLLTSPNPARTVTPASVAGHMIYEVEHPYLQEEPEGTLDFTDVTMRAEGDATHISGSRFTSRPVPTLRFEGAELRGYRSFIIGATRDPFLIEQIDGYVEACSEQICELEANQRDFELDWKIYGRNGVMGCMEPLRNHANHEVGILAQVLAPTQDRAHDIAALLEARMIGVAYAGAKTRTAHIAFPFSPLVSDNGPVYRFGVLHIVDLKSRDDLLQLFPIQFENL